MVKQLNNQALYTDIILTSMEINVQLRLLQQLDLEGSLREEVVCLNKLIFIKSPRITYLFLCLKISFTNYNSYEQVIGDIFCADRLHACH